MRINGRVVVDIETGKVVERDSCEYGGAVALAWGGGSSTTVNSGSQVVWDRRPEEQGSFDLFGGIIDQMLQDQGYDLKKTPKTENFNTELKAGIDQKTARIAELDNTISTWGQLNTTGVYPVEQLNQMKAEREALSKELKADTAEYQKGITQLQQQIQSGKLGKFDLSLERKPLTAEQQKERDLESKLQDYYSGVLGDGMNDVPPALKGYIDEIYADQDRIAKEQLMKMGVEMAGSRGLNMSDTPIAQPLLQQYANVQSQLGAARAGSYLGERSSAIARAQAFREFQANLNQLRNFTVPNAMLSQVANLGLGLYQPRFRGGVGATTPAGGGAGATLAGISGVLGGLGNLANVKVNQQGGTLGGSIVSGIAGLFGGGGSTG